MAEFSQSLFANRRRLFTIFVFICLTSVSPAASASTYVTVEDPTVQATTTQFEYNGSENWDTRPAGTLKQYSSTFGPSSGGVVGTYYGPQVINRDQWGGAGRAGTYAGCRDKLTYQLNLTKTGHRGVNYFGLWVSSVDTGNQLEFYNKGSKLIAIDMTQVLQLAKRIPQYMGNPSSTPPTNMGQPSAFVNIYFNDLLYTEVKFLQRAGGYFESDNHTVGYFKTQTGTIILSQSESEEAPVTSESRITVTAELPNAQSSSTRFKYWGTETFDSTPQGPQQKYQSNFGKGACNTLQGTYYGPEIKPFDKWGGAGSAGKYAGLIGGKTYRLVLPKIGQGGINYFGLWISSMDAGNKLDFYYKNKIIFTLNTGEILAMVNKPVYVNSKTGQPAAFINVYFNNVSVDEVKFSQTYQGWFESDSHTVGHFLSLSGRITRSVKLA